MQIILLNFLTPFFYVPCLAFTKKCHVQYSNDDLYASYPNLMSAKLACENDEACGSVDDLRCNFIGEMKLAKKGAKEVPSEIGSCIHIKDQQTTGQFPLHTYTN